MAGLLVAAAVLAGGWVGYQRHPQQVQGARTDAPVLADATPAAEVPLPSHPPAEKPQLPPPDQRERPAPGYEEGVTALGAAPSVPATSAEYSFSLTQTIPGGGSVPVTWSPCRPIHYVVDPTGAPSGFRGYVQLTTAEVHTATGLVFIEDAETMETPDVDRPPFQPSVYGDRWSPVLIRFADESTVRELEGDVAGVAAPIRAHDLITGALHMVSGAVYLDTDILSSPDVRGAPAYVPVLRHELGHLVGLAHVADETQLMYPTTADVATFQSGDLAGLAALGRGSCAPGL